MAPPVHTELSSSDSENEAPEAVSLSQTKEVSRSREKTLREHQLAEREKQRAKNRERDRILKEQALKSKKRKGKDTEDGEERNDAETRMLRAMQQAEEESEEGEDSDEDGESGELDFEVEDVQDGEGDDESSENEGEEDEQDDVEMGQDDSESESEALHSNTTTTPSKRSTRLPDHVFKAAATTATSSSRKKSVPIKDSPKSSQKTSRRRKKSSSKGPKEAVIGGRTVKVLASADGFPTSSSSMVPSAKIKRFLDRSLSLKGTKSKSRGWERRPVNIGSMRRQGPVANFVRNS